MALARDLTIMAAACAVTVGIGTVAMPVVEWPAVEHLPSVLPPLQAARVVESGGVLQRQRAGAWVDVASKERILVDDLVRVGSGSFAWFETDGGTRVQVAARSLLTFVLGDDGVTRPHLLDGALRIPEGQGRVEVDVGDGRIVVADAGPVIVQLSEKHGLRIANLGPVDARLMVGGREVVIAGGDGVEQEARDAALEVAEAAAPKPSRLDVAKPRSTVSADNIVVTGSVDPGSTAETVMVGGLEAVVAPDGTFHAVVPLDLGVNRINVVVRDVFGNEEVYEIPPVKRLTAEEVRALRFEWNKQGDEKGASTTWGR